MLFLIYFGLADFGIIFDAFPAAVLGLGLSGAAYMAEIFRAGIESIHRGQMEAALTVGLTPMAAMRWVILPQALRVVLPPLANFGIALLKDTSVASIISAPELMLRARDLASSSFLPLEVFLLAAAIYLVMSLPVAFLTRQTGGTLLARAGACVGGLSVGVTMRRSVAKAGGSRSRQGILTPAPHPVRRERGTR